MARKKSERLERAARLLRGSSSGLTRHELAEEMGIPLQSVCVIALQLLRDGSAVYKRHPRFKRALERRTTKYGGKALVLAAAPNPTLVP